MRFFEVGAFYFRLIDNLGFFIVMAQVVIACVSEVTEEDVFRILGQS